MFGDPTKAKKKVFDVGNRCIIFKIIQKSLALGFYIGFLCHVIGIGYSWLYLIIM